jgi:cation transport regulator ChaB
MSYMPYKYPSNIPEGIKKLPVEAQKTWIDIFNSAWETYKDRDDQEALAAATAWAGLKKAGWKKDKEGNWVKTGEQGNLTTMELALLEAYSQTYELKGVEVFGTGEWNKHKITDEDLDNIVNGTNEIIDKLKPKVKLGHDDKQELLQKSGLPAGGWITKLKKVGNKILVDIKEVPKVLYELIKNGAYKRVSSEILYDYTEPSTKKRYAKVLSAIAFLGGDLPAVTNLKDIAALYDDVNEEAILIIYEKKPTQKVENKKKGVEYIMVNGIKVTEFENKKFVAVEDFEKLEKEKEAADKEKETAKGFKEKFEAEEKKSKESEEKLNKISEEKREAEIKTFTDSHCSEKDLRFLPKQKEILMTLIESTSDEKIIKFTLDKKEVELSQRELLEKFIELQPNFSDKIFAELSKDGEKEKEGEDKLTPEEKKVQKYMAEHKDVSYRNAVLKVLKTTEEKKK